jgi:hypothetical protein
MKYKFVELTKDELEELNRPVAGQGGFQTFLRGLQKQVNHAVGTVKLTDDDIENIAHYAFDYQQGGFEDRLLKIFGRALGAKLGCSD